MYVVIHSKLLIKVINFVSFTRNQFSLNIRSQYTHLNTFPSSLSLPPQLSFTPSLPPSLPLSFYHLLHPSPCRELAIQIAEQFGVLGAAMGVRVALVIGGMNMMKQGAELARRPHIVIATPGRLRHHIESADPPAGNSNRHTHTSIPLDLFP